MSRGTCSRCGSEESVFWYPYGFAVSPLPSVRDCSIDRTQYFTLCDKCQHEFIEFMHNKPWPFFDVDKIKEMMDNTPPMPIMTNITQEAKQ